MTAGENLAAVVGAQLRAGELGYVRRTTPMLPPPSGEEAEALDAWMTRTARPEAPAATAPNFDAMTHAQVRAAMFDLHHRLTLMTMERDGLARELDDSTEGYRARIRELQRERSALMGRVAELESLAAGPRTNTQEGV